jgi:hypothetical protein
MNAELYHYYGKRFLEEFGKYSSDNLKLFIIFEGDYPDEIMHISENIYIFPLSNPKHSSFLKKFRHLHEANGLRIRDIKVEGKIKKHLSYDYRWNAIRFSFKPFSIHQVLDVLPENTDFLIWTDSDLRCKKNFSSEDLIEFMPTNNEVMSYLGRKDSYSECGFLGFNLNNKFTSMYIERMINIYETGEIFSIDQWHDSFIWDWARKEFEEKNELNFKDISGSGYDKEHVFMNTKLSNFFDHLKGPQRKQDGISKEEDNSRAISGKIIIK